MLLAASIGGQGAEAKHEQGCDKTERWARAWRNILIQAIAFRAIPLPEPVPDGQVGPVSRELLQLFTQGAPLDFAIEASRLKTVRSLTAFAMLVPPLLLGALVV